MRKRHSHIKETKIEIIPMIDTMFFLLVFFLLSSLSLISVSGQKVKLPKAQTAVTPKKRADLTVTVKPDGQTVIDNTTFAPADVGDALVRSAQRTGLLPNTPNVDTVADKAGNLVVVINADADTDNAAVVKAIDSARAKGFVQFGIAARGKSALQQERRNGIQ
ncbi:MAG: biopolymer transporter ExbD [Armatimonadetes bacterium]|nr:biopolymer transporter ExbD [Armatimonadota bacterium]